MIKKIPHKHKCASTGQVENNCMATKFWVRDRVLPWLREDPTHGAAYLLKKLQDKYLIKLSYYVVWDGRQLALDELMGRWEVSFEHAFAFKAEIERVSPGSIVEVEYELIGSKMRFKGMFIALKACIDGFLNGCRPYFWVDSTVLTGRWRGQLACAVGIDGHNWMFPVAYGVFGSESLDSGKWFMQMLAKAIGSPKGLVISTDAGKGIDGAVTAVFTNGVEHRECMRHLYKNFKKRFHGEVFERHLWPASRAYRKDVFDMHNNIMKEASPRAISWIAQNHKHLWARSNFSTDSKCDYVTNNIAETFNSWIKTEKSLPALELMDAIRKKIADKMYIRRRLANKLRGRILPHIMKDLFTKSRGLRTYVLHKHADLVCAVSGVHKDLTPWRHVVNLPKRECSCMQWQHTRIPCTHAINYIGSLRNEDLDRYVHECYSVQKFQAAYAGVIEPMTDKSQWPKVDLGFKLWPPILKRSAGRPRTRRIKGVEEGGSTKRRSKCKRCGQLGHLQKTCNETVYDSDAPPPAPPKPKRIRKKKTKDVVTVESNTPTKLLWQAPFDVTNSPGALTRSRKRSLELGDSPCFLMGEGSQNLIQCPGALTRSRKRALDLSSSTCCLLGEGSPGS